MQVLSLPALFLLFLCLPYNHVDAHGIFKYMHGQFYAYMTLQILYLP